MLDEMLRRTHLCVSLNEAETRKERTSASGGKIEALCLVTRGRRRQVDRIWNRIKQQIKENDSDQ